MSNKNIHLQIDINALREFIVANPSFVFKGKKDYISLTLWANEVPDNFGNDFAIKPRRSKELKAAEVKIPYVGNAKFAEAYVNSKPQTPIRNAVVKPIIDDSVPF
jgi:hypothetical protein